ncbi:O-methyltransferase [Cohnella hashimotonis]|uniref:O-methyltransferase n=1 Tax=Cohnella hashimotonis TaxID=2826895 RepID=A0ABT6TLH2_9BACL|nr:O-methyltransferase [Cohnella hashimotonis]MDI4647702.1 O-methyltransferase [Cohnella hashimotonis]
MSESQKWTAVDRYIEERLIPKDEALEKALSANRDAGLPSIDVAANQGKLLHLLARMQGAKRILEIGTLGGYSTIWLARALPADGKLVTLELEPHYAGVARRNFAHAGVDGLIEVKVGPALAQLSLMAEEGEAPFDLIFIDADKPNNPAYLGLALKLSRPGTVIIGDNVVRDGEILREDSADDRVQGIRGFFDMLAAEPGVDATAIQTVGVKGYDGFAIGIVS